MQQAMRASCTLLASCFLLLASCFCLLFSYTKELPMPDYIPGPELALNAWAANFASLIAAAPTTYGLMPSDAANITAVQTAFSTALELATEPGTKTKATVADKDAKKAVMLSILRQYAQTIRRNLAISNDAKVALGLTVPSSGRTPVPAPSTKPVLAVTEVASLQHVLRYVDITTPDRRGKPAGAERLQLFRAVGSTPPHRPGTGDVCRRRDPAARRGRTEPRRCRQERLLLRPLGDAYQPGRTVLGRGLCADHFVMNLVPIPDEMNHRGHREHRDGPMKLKNI
jgi:hypothetical protein